MGVSCEVKLHTVVAAIIRDSLSCIKVDFSIGNTSTEHPAMLMCQWLFSRKKL